MLSYGASSEVDAFLFGRRNKNSFKGFRWLIDTARKKPQDNLDQVFLHTSNLGHPNRLHFPLFCTRSVPRCCTVLNEKSVCCVRKGNKTADINVTCFNTVVFQPRVPFSLLLVNDQLRLHVTMQSSWFDGDFALLGDKSTTLLQKNFVLKLFWIIQTKGSAFVQFFKVFFALSVACVQLLPTLAASGPHTSRQTLCLRRWTQNHWGDVKTTSNFEMPI